MRLAVAPNHSADALEAVVRSDEARLRGRVDPAAEVKYLRRNRVWSPDHNKQTLSSYLQPLDFSLHSQCLPVRFGAAGALIVQIVPMRSSPAADWL
jgi:hypothetical protein